MFSIDIRIDLPFSLYLFVGRSLQTIGSSKGFMKIELNWQKMVYILIQHQYASRFSFSRLSEIEIIYVSSLRNFFSRRICYFCQLSLHSIAILISISIALWHITHSLRCTNTRLYHIPQSQLPAGLPIRDSRFSMCRWCQSNF